jgi:hypothetical protein
MSVLFELVVLARPEEGHHRLHKKERLLMDPHLPFAGILARRRQGPLGRIKEVAIAMAVLALPVLGLFRVAQEVRVLQILSGDGVTVSGDTAAGTSISLTSYPGEASGGTGTLPGLDGVQSPASPGASWAGPVCSACPACVDPATER